MSAVGSRRSAWTDAGRHLALRTTVPSQSSPSL